MTLNPGHLFPLHHDDLFIKPGLHRAEIGPGEAFESLLGGPATFPTIVQIMALLAGSGMETIRHLLSGAFPECHTVEMRRNGRSTIPQTEHADLPFRTGEECFTSETHRPSHFQIRISRA